MHIYIIFSYLCYYFSRYHNGTLLDRKVYKYEEDLVLRDLKPEQSGQYYCKTSSPAGSIKSTPSFLTVIGMCSMDVSVVFLRCYLILHIPSHIVQDVLLAIINHMTGDTCKCW